MVTFPQLSYFLMIKYGFFIDERDKESTAHYIVVDRKNDSKLSRALSGSVYPSLVAGINLSHLIILHNRSHVCWLLESKMDQDISNHGIDISPYPGYPCNKTIGSKFRQRMTRWKTMVKKMGKIMFNFVLCSQLYIMWALGLLNLARWCPNSDPVYLWEWQSG